MNSSGPPSVTLNTGSPKAFRAFSFKSTLPARERARAAAWLPQAREIAWPVTVETLVALGRLPHDSRAGALRTEVALMCDAAG